MSTTTLPAADHAMADPYALRPEDARPAPETFRGRFCHLGPGFWCPEMGYARWTGPDDGTEERARRAEGWIKVMRLDALAGLAVCVLCTLSFYVIGTAVLHPQGLVPQATR